MKPLKLEFSGLNSYRDAQAVDFEELGQSGLFGIFGPTGSGKSTILDAVTLALYGTVDRAAYGTQGIINMQEKTAEVSFTFELGGSRYEVRRKYIRPSSDPGSARARTALLVRNANEVLADRADTVTAEVQRIVGLTPDEFSRAVVLPQGKFDEFLTLKGAERADMLGHIFNLERFGDRLYRAADRRRGHHQGEINAAETAKAEIGDCSDTAIQSAQTDAAKAKEEAKRIEEAHVKVKKRLEDAAELKKLNDNLKVMQTRRAALDARKASIDKDQTTLDAARRAKPLKTVIDGVARLASEREKAAEKAKHTAADCDVAQSKLSIAEAEARSSRERQEREEPSLIERKTRLATALSEKKKLDETMVKRDELGYALREVEGKIGEAKQEVSSRELELKTLAGTIESLTRRQQNLTVDSEARERIDNAVALIAPLESADRELIRSQRDLDGKRKASDTARNQVLRVFAALSQIATSRYSLSDTGALVEGTAVIPSMDDATSGAEFLAAADREIDIAVSLVAQASEKAKQALIQEHAAVLAAELEEGKPCPVCGSLHHPNIAVGGTGFSDRARESHGVLESSLGKLHSWKTRLQASVTEWDNAKLNEYEAANAVRDREDELDRTLCMFREAAKQALGELYAEDTARSLVRKNKQQITDKDKERPKVDTQLTTTREKETATRKLLEDANAKVAALQNQYSAKSSEMSMLDAQAKSLETTVRDMSGGVDPSRAIASVESSIKNLRELAKNAAAQEESARRKLTEVTKAATTAESALEQIEAELKEQRLTLDKGLASAGFGSAEESAASWLPDHSIRELEKNISDYNNASSEINGQLRQITEQIGDRQFSEEEYLTLDAKVAELSEREKAARDAAAVANERLLDMRAKRVRWDEWEAKRVEAEKKRDVSARLMLLVRGRAFVKFLAEEHLRDMAADASARLGSLTGQRYALETSGESDFVIRDDFNGGQRRAVNTLSGGETFLTSLSLALALSSKVQLRGQYPLGFFFLDEGFGTLDEEKLDAVIGALERLHDRNRLVGVISHVKDLKERLPYYLEVIAAGGDGSGSRVAMRRN